jgi:outer membrane protein assembly factor BamB
MQINAKIILIGFVLLASSLCFAADWPGFRGPNRDGKSPETGLMKEWPQDGPKMLWSVEGLGIGFSSAAIADGRIFTTGMDENKQGIIFAFDLAGKPKWQKPYGPEWKGDHKGARTTPTIDGDRVYVFSGYGNLVCFDAESGEQKWQIDTMTKYEAKNLKWGLSESVLIYGDKVICTPGGKDAAMAAFDKLTGKEIWTTKGLWCKDKKDVLQAERAAYCAPLIYKIGGRELIVTNVQKSVILVEPCTGKVVLRIPHEKRHDLAAVSPIFENNYLYVTTGYTKDGMPNRGMMFKISDDSTSFTPGWTERKLDCHHGGLILLDGHIYGTNSVIYPPGSAEKLKGTWYCLELATGTIKHDAKLVGKGSVIFAEGLLYCYGENGQVALVKATPNSYKMISSFEITKGTEEHWAHPSISNGVMYIRHGDAMMAYDIKQK